VFLAHAGLSQNIPGGLGVTIFFFLSGYLITSLLRAEWSQTGHISLRRFYSRRALRILPPLYIVLGFTWILDAVNIPEHRATGLGILSVVLYFYNYLMLLHPQAAGIPIGINVVWSLTIEEHFYFLFPLIYLILRRRSISTRNIVMNLAGVCLAALLWRAALIFYFHMSSTAEPVWTYVATDARFDSILWGCILAIGANPWSGDKSEFLEKHKGWFSLGGIVLLLLTLIIRSPQFRETLRYTLQGLALLPIFYYVVSSPGNWKCRWLGWRPLRWIGWLSYTMYLCHDFFLYSLLHVMANWPPVLTKILATIMTVLFSESVRRLVENPIRHLKMRRYMELSAKT
jgi:peptidoglycan/LPS O-acetylase OafA/YrhL